MSTEDNKALVRRYLATLWEQWNTPAVEALFAPHYQRHLTPHTPSLPCEGFRQRLARFRAVFIEVWGMA